MKRIPSILIVSVFVFITGVGQVVAQSNATDTTDIQQLRELAQSGDASAQHRLGGLLLAKRNPERGDVFEAAAWYERSATEGYAPAQVALGALYLTGRGVPRNLERAVYWYRQAAEKNEPIAQHNLAGLIQNGWGTKTDYVSAAAWYRRAADNGFVKSQTMMGRILTERLLAVQAGLVWDRSQGIVWLRKAGEQGDAEAQRLLGEIYKSGDGVEKNPQAAAEWLKKAASQEDGSAQNLLSELYCSGSGVGKDHKECYFWARLAMDHGVQRAKNRVSLLRTKMKPSDIDVVEARVSQWQAQRQ